MQYLPRTLLCLLLLSLFCATKAQDIDGGSFENWRDINGYEEPVGANGDTLFWGTNNKLSLLGGGPLTTFRESEDVYQGNYAVKLVSKYWDLEPQPLGVAAILASGYFEANIADLTKSFRLGRPWTTRPTRFKGYYKYFPQEDDQCAIYARLTKYNTDSGQQDTIGEASLTVFETVNEYTAFDLEFDYVSNETPDSITIVFTPSAYGYEFLIGGNSTLLIDEVSLSYDPIDIQLIGENPMLQLYPNPSTGQLQIQGDLSEVQSLEIFDLQGALVYSQAFESTNNSALDLSYLANSTYLYRFKLHNEKQSTGFLEISR